MDTLQELRLMMPGEIIRPVGSRVTCDPAPQDTDEDFLIYGDHAERLIGNGFHQEGSPEFYTGNDAGGFRSFRKGRVNVITTPDHDFFLRFMAATELARRFNLQRKADRIALFQAVLYGVAAENLEAA